MRILVCIKQVPDPESRPELDERKGWVKTDPWLRFRTNPCDEYALEEALRIKESFDGTVIDALSVGPERVCEVLRKAIAMGADRAVHLHHPLDGFLAAQTTAKLIAAFAASQGYDLILTGVMAEDDMQGLVGPMTADLLGISCAVAVVEARPDQLRKTIRLTCELDRGRRQEILLPMPALIAVQSGINRPRYPSVGNMLRSRTQEIRTVVAEDGLDDLCQSVALPRKSGKTEFIEGSLDEKAEKLLGIFSKMSLLR